MEQPPIFVIEGTDGSGKATQTTLLRDWLEDQGHAVTSFSFPQYGQASARHVERYLSGELGTLEEITAHEAAVYYAYDRFVAQGAMRDALLAGHIILCDRYTASNLAHQGAKIADTAQRRRFYGWLHQVEHNFFGILQPHQTFVLRVLPQQAQALALANQNAARAHLAGQRPDLHETDLGHLTTAAECYLELCRLFPEHYTLIECLDTEGQLMEPARINQKIRQQITRYLDHSM